MNRTKTPDFLQIFSQILSPNFPRFQGVHRYVRIKELSCVNGPLWALLDVYLALFVCCAIFKKLWLIFKRHTFLQYMQDTKTSENWSSQKFLSLSSKSSQIPKILHSDDRNKELPCLNGPLWALLDFYLALFVFCEICKETRTHHQKLCFTNICKRARLVKIDAYKHF